MTDHDDHEQLAEGVGSVLAGDDDDSPGRRVRIVPIGEGDITRGASGDVKRWPREALKAAVDDGTLDGALIVKGEGGESPHFPLDEQVPPENILGKVDEWTYEDGTGPVGHADLADEDIADRIELGLLDVSADLFHNVADPDADVMDVSEIVGMPRVTVLEHGASHSASIEADTAAALGLDPDEYAADQTPGDGAGDGAGDDDIQTDQFAAATITTPQFSGTSTASWEPPTLRGTYDGDLDAARQAALVEFRPVNTFSDDLALWVVDGEGQLNRNALEAAWNLAPQVAGLSDDAVERARGRLVTLANNNFDEHNVGPASAQNALTRWLKRGWELLAPPDDAPASAMTPPDAPASIATGPQLPYDIGADADSTETETMGAATEDGTAASDTPVDPADPDTTNPMTDDDLTLQEQLAEARAQNTTLESQLDQKDTELEQLRDDLEDKEDRIEQLQADLDAAEDAKEDAEKDLEQLREEVGPWKEMLAQIAAGDSMLDPEDIAASQSFEQLSENVLNEFADEDTDQSPMDRLEAQLSDTVRSRGDAPDDDGLGGGLTEEQAAEADQLAESIMTVSDLQQAESEGLAPREYVAQKHGVDPVAADSEAELRRQKAANGGD